LFRASFFLARQVLAEISRLVPRLSYAVLAQQASCAAQKRWKKIWQALTLGAVGDC
jgi:hypothetical protein